MGGTEFYVRAAVKNSKATIPPVTYKYPVVAIHFHAGASVFTLIDLNS